jgi:hypothetical protein
MLQYFTTPPTEEMGSQLVSWTIFNTLGQPHHVWEPHSRSRRHPLDQDYEGVSKSFRTVRLERELHMVQLSATKCSCIAILWVSLVSFAAITLCVASQRVFIVVYFVIDSVRKLFDTPSYTLDQGYATLTERRQRSQMGGWSFGTRWCILHLNCLKLILMYFNCNN